MKSMTGYGKSEAPTDKGKITVETRSENHRFLDIKLQMPESTLSLEPRLTDVVKKKILRGKIRAMISMDGIKTTSYELNTELLKETKRNLDKLVKELGIDEKPGLDHFLGVKDIFSAENTETVTKKQAADIEKALGAAIRKLDESRISEGRKLEKDLSKRIRKIEKLSQKISAKRQDFMKNAASKIKERIEKLLDDTQIDEYRLYQEVSYLAERSDITEELVRLNAHLSKFRETMAREGSIGKELDFLLQEMNREAGTVSAKAKDAQVSHMIIDLRSELEKIREQVQNIE